MMASSNNRVLMTFQANVSQAKSAAESLANSMQGLSQSTQQAENAANKLGAAGPALGRSIGGVITKISAAVIAIQGLSGAFKRLIQDGANFEDWADGKWSKTVKAMSKSVDGIIDSLTLQRGAMQLTTGDYKATQQQMEQLSKAAVILARRTGGDATQAFNTLVDAIVGGRPTRAFRALGLDVQLSGNATEKTAQAWGYLRILMKRTTVTVANTNERMSQLKGEITNATTAIGQAIIKSDMFKNALSNIGLSLKWLNDQLREQSLFSMRVDLIQAKAALKELEKSGHQMVIDAAKHRIRMLERNISAYLGARDAARIAKKAQNLKELADKKAMEKELDDQKRKYKHGKYAVKKGGATKPKTEKDDHELKALQDLIKRKQDIQVHAEKQLALRLAELRERQQMGKDELDFQVERKQKALDVAKAGMSERIALIRWEHQQRLRAHNEELALAKLTASQKLKLALAEAEKERSVALATLDLKKLTAAEAARAIEAIERKHQQVVEGATRRHQAQQYGIERRFNLNRQKLFASTKDKEQELLEKHREKLKGYADAAFETISASILSAQSAGQAIASITGNSIVQLSKMAIPYATKNIALGLEALGMFNFYSAAKHFGAAALWGTLAIGGQAIGGAISNAGSSSGGSASPESLGSPASVRDRSLPERNSPAPQGQQDRGKLILDIRLDGKKGMYTRREIERALVNATHGRI